MNATTQGAIMDKEITMRAKAFSNESIREYKMIVETNGNVLVYDSTDGHYTNCHSLCKSAILRARKMAI